MSSQSAKKSLEVMVVETIRSLGFDNPARMATTKKFLEIDESTCDRVRALKPTAEKHINHILDDIYTHLQRFPETGKFLPNEATIDRLKGAQRVYFTKLMSGNYDSEYLENVVRVGLAHVRIDLKPEWYLGTYSKYLCAVVASLFDESKGDSFFSRLKADSKGELREAIQALIKVFFLDMTLTIKSYVGPLMTDLENEKQKASKQVAQLRELSNRIMSSVQENTENVNTVSSAAEEMSTTIREISRNVQESTQITAEAVEKTESTSGNIEKLVASAEEIGKMVKVIRSIAQQTNLLALNATIESARAGDAGKGFAVVANEVKELSKGTAKATDDISQMISAIQKETEGAVESVTVVQEIIQKINGIVTSIAGAVEEQSVTTDEMTQSIAQAASRMTEVTEDIKACEAATGDLA